MCCGKKWRLPPTPVPTGPTTLVNPGTTTAGTPSTVAPYDKLLITVTRIRVLNPTATAATVSLFISPTTNTGGTGNAFAWSLKSVPANDFIEMFCRKPIYTIDFLCGSSGTNNALTIEMDGTIEIS